MSYALDPDAVGLRLARIDQADNLILCEGVKFQNRSAVDTVLRRAAISGRVDLNGEIEDHFADVLDETGSIVDTVSLDRKSYSALKNRWMRCRVAKD